MTREEAEQILRVNNYCFEHFKLARTCEKCRDERMERWEETVRLRDKQLSEAISLLKAAQ